MMDPGNHPILLIEDDPNDQVLIRRAFAKAKLMNPLHMVDDGDAAVDYLAGDGQYADRQLHPCPRSSCSTSSCRAALAWRFWNGCVPSQVAGALPSLS
jgi:hypothetical protein